MLGHGTLFVKAGIGDIGLLRSSIQKSIDAEAAVV
jgi:hypothetical protein